MLDPNSIDDRRTVLLEVDRILQQRFFYDDRNSFALPSIPSNDVLCSSGMVTENVVYDMFTYEREYFEVVISHLELVNLGFIDCIDCDEFKRYCFMEYDFSLHQPIEVHRRTYDATYLISGQPIIHKYQQKVLSDLAVKRKELEDLRNLLPNEPVIRLRFLRNNHYYESDVRRCNNEIIRLERASTVLCSAIDEVTDQVIEEFNRRTVDEPTRNDLNRRIQEMEEDVEQVMLRNFVEEANAVEESVFAGLNLHTVTANLSDLPPVVEDVNDSDSYARVSDSVIPLVGAPGNTWFDVINNRLCISDGSNWLAVSQTLTNANSNMENHRNVVRKHVNKKPKAKQDWYEKSKEKRRDVDV